MGKDDFLKLIMMLFFLILFLKYLIYIILNKITINFSAKIKIFISSKFFYSYASKDYIFFKNSNSSFLLRDLLIEVGEFCDRLILSGINLTIELLIILSIVFFLFLKETNLIILFIIYIIPISVVFYFLVKKKIEKAALTRSEVDERKFFIAKNFFSNLKLIKSGNKENFFLKKFNDYVTNFEFTFANFNFIQIISRPFFEFVGLAFVFLWIIFNINKNIDLSEIFLSLGILVAAVIRILPAINRVMYNIGQVKFSKPSTDIVFKEFKNLDKIKNRNFLNKIDVIFEKEIFLKNLSFSYDKSKNILLKNINLKINKGEKICFLGESGSGKSTLLDIISGLLNPTNGSIIIDKKLIFNPRNQKLNLTYVQQDLSLLDGTIAENISFGEDFNKDKLIHSIKFSLLNKLMKEKKDFFSSNVGEVGKKFSGGQRQRINLARGFYENKDLIIFDESVNALDQKTKLILVENIFLQLENKTIIFALHDKSFLDKFDKIYELKNGKLTRL
jgi:ATP-binding cassette subfamily B protein